MNLIRSIMSVFMVIIVLLALIGLRWAAGQPSPKAEGASLALALCGLMSLGCLGVMWSTKKPQPH